MKNLKLILAGTALAFSFNAFAVEAPKAAQVAPVAVTTAKPVVATPAKPAVVNPAIKTGAEKADAAQLARDDARAKADAAQAKKLFASAAQHSKNAVALHTKAHALWEQQMKVNHQAAQESAAAAYDNRIAGALNAEANRLFRAENERRLALDLRIRADGYDRTGQVEEHTVSVGEAAVRSGNNALKDLGNIAAFANAVKDIKLDIAGQEVRIKAHKAAAVAAFAKAKSQREEAVKHEAIAASIEKTPLFPIVIVAVKVKPVEKVETPPAAKKAADQIAATVVKTTTPAVQAAPVVEQKK